MTRPENPSLQLGPPERDPTELSWPDSASRLWRQLPLTREEGNPGSEIIREDRQERI